MNENAAVNATNGRLEVIKSIAQLMGVADISMMSSTGRLPGCSVRALLGYQDSVSITTPKTVWDYDGLEPRLTSPVAIEVLSSSTSDTSAGTGARTINLTLVDGNYVESTVSVIMDGTSVVSVPGTWLHVNGAVVSSAGTGTVNAGNISIRVASGGAMMGYIKTGIGQDRKASILVPAGKTFLVHTFLGLASVAGGAAKTVKVLPRLFSHSGVEVEVLPFILTSGSAVQVNANDGFQTPEKMLRTYQYVEPDSAGMHLAWSVVGVMIDNTL